ncbi:hypothetical protein BZZ08_02782 [Streptomyces sp. MH60]|nr:hypothetical protein BZZ08_02782 [Streptomyces sp. MH60]
MRAAQPGAAGQALGRERAEGLQHPVAALGQVLQEGLLHQRGQQVLRVRHPAHRLHGLQRGAPGEHRQPPGQLPLLLGQQLPAPLDDGAQRAVAGRLGTVAPAEQTETVVQAVGQLVRAEGAQPGRGQLDGQGQPVQGRADLRHARVAVEAGAHRAGAFQEQLDRRARRQRRNRHQGLAGDPEALPAGGEDPYAPAGAQQQCRQCGGGVDQVLAVVEHEQRLAVLQGGQQPLGGVHARGAEALAHPERGEHGVRDLSAVGQGRQLDEADVRRGDRRLAPARRLDREPGLAGAAGTGERDQACVGEQGRDAVQLRVPADTAGQLGGQPGAARGGGGAPQQFTVEGGQLGRGVGAELLGQRAPRLLVHGQRLGGPSARVQGPHQLPVQPLAQGMPGQQSPQLGHQLGATPERQIRLDPVLYGGQPQLREPGRLGGRLRQVGQRGTAPQRERLTQSGRRARVVTGGESGAPRLAQTFEYVTVDGRGRRDDAVSRAAALDGCVRGQPPAKARDLRLEGVRGTGGRLGAVQAVDQPGRGDRATGVEEQERQQRSGAGAAGVDGGAVVGADVQGAEDPEAHSRDSGTAESRPTRGGPAPCSGPGSGRALS